VASADLRRRRPLADGGFVHVRFTERADGDLRTTDPAAGLAARRRAVVDRPWIWVRQVHGADVLVVGSDDDPAAVAGQDADAIVTSRCDVAVAVHTADCAPVALWSPEGVLGVAHAGWRGLVDGVIEATVAAMRSVGASTVEGILGPCIRPDRYAFGDADLAIVADRYGPTVRSTTNDGAPALDVPAAVRQAVQRATGTPPIEVGSCTAADVERHWSHRARTDVQRQAVVVWRTAPEQGS